MFDYILSIDRMSNFSLMDDYLKNSMSLENIIACLGVLPSNSIPCMHEFLVCNWAILFEFYIYMVGVANLFIKVLSV